MDQIERSSTDKLPNFNAPKMFCKWDEKSLIALQVPGEGKSIIKTPSIVRTVMQRNFHFRRFYYTSKPSRCRMGIALATEVLLPCLIRNSAM